MIIADLTHLARQVPLTPAFRKALDFLARPALDRLPDGTTELDGRTVFAIVQRYETLRTGAPRFEFHRNYIDIQFVVSGEEILGWIPREQMSVTDAYDAEKDIAFGSVEPGAWTPLLLGANRAAVLYPEDGHAPRLAVDAPCRVLKIVIKIAVRDAS